MSRKPGFLPLPGISTRDPNFYDGADYKDRDRFALPINTSPAPATPEQPRPRVAPELGGGGEEVPPTQYPTGANPRPFKLK